MPIPKLNSTIIFYLYLDKRLIADFNETLNACQNRLLPFYKKNRSPCVSYKMNIRPGYY